MNGRDLRQLYDLITASIEGDILPEQFLHLKALLRSHPKAMRYYVDYITILTHIRASDSIDQVTDHESFDAAFWELLSRHENVAPAIDMPPIRPRQDDDVMHAVERPAEVHKIRKTSIFSLIASAAAVVFLVLFARFAPPKSGVPVATLHDSINASWADTHRSMRNGTRLETSAELLLLRGGLATLVFDNDARIVIEGPAEFQILTSDQVKLNYGRVYAIIPPQAYGFQVTTPDAKIIDLGTEFGIQQDMFGNTELHVISGKTSLISRIHGNQINAYVEAGGAKRLDVGAGQLDDIAYNGTLFVRHIDSETHFIWRGRNVLDLADIVGGGNGFGTGTLDSGIETNTGRRFESPAPELVRSEVSGILYGGGSYNQADSVAFIDGVFVPDSRQGPVQITSAGHVFDGFTDGREVFWGNIFHGAWHASDQATKHPLTLNGQAYGTPDNPAISMHSNQGVTFDLRAIRQMIPGGRVRRFTSLFGVSETVALAPSYDSNAGINLGKVNCWVLVDGKERFNRNSVSYLHGAIAIDVDIRDEDRFLTLVVTESDDRRAFDWAFFARPSLLIEVNLN